MVFVMSQVANATDHPGELLFAVDRAEYVGQIIGMVLASSRQAAEAAAAMVSVQYDHSGEVRIP